MSQFHIQHPSMQFSPALPFHPLSPQNVAKTSKKINKFFSQSETTGPVTPETTIQHRDAHNNPVMASELDLHGMKAPDDFPPVVNAVGILFILLICIAAAFVCGRWYEEGRARDTSKQGADEEVSE